MVLTITDEEFIQMKMVVADRDKERCSADCQGTRQASRTAEKPPDEVSILTDVLKRG